MNTSDHISAIREQGYTVVESLLTDDDINRLKSALQPWLQGQFMGRNNFEGEKSERVYALLAKYGRRKTPWILRSGATIRHHAHQNSWGR